MEGAISEKRYLILVPALHFMKRLLFVSLVVVAPEFIWLLVALLNFTALSSASFTLWYMPFDGRRANLFSVFDDVTLLLLTYLLWSFSDLFDDPVLRNNLGFVFIAIDLGNVVVHLLFLAYDSFKKIKMRCMRYKCCLKRFKKSPNAQR